MDVKGIVGMALEELDRDLYEALDGLTPQELAWQPGPEANPIGWLVWHMTRAEDNWIQKYGQGELPIWEGEGWCGRFGLPAEDHSGYGFSAEQVSAFPRIVVRELLCYHEAVRQGTLTFLATLSPDKLEECPQTGPPYHKSIGSMLSHVICEIGQHVGHVRYVRGLQRGLNK